MKRPRKARKVVVRESPLAIGCANFLDCALPVGARFTHIPNGGKRDAITAAILKREGVRAGAPDYVIAVPGLGVIFAELKADDGVLSSAQLAWGETLRAVPGVTYGVIYGVEDLERLLVSAGVKLRASVLALRR